MSRDPLPRPDERDWLRGGLVTLYDMTNTFLGLVQPRYLTWMQENKQVDLGSKDDILDSIEDNYWDWIEYWVGFTICAVVGILALIIIPIAGICTGCCRCCGNCGGNPPAKKTKHSTCKRVSCSVALMLLTFTFIAGASCILVLNEDIKDQVVGDDSVFDVLGDSLGAVEGYMATSVDQLNVTVLGGYTRTADEVFTNLRMISKDSMKQIDEETNVVTAYLNLKSFVGNITTLISHLDMVNNSTEQLVTMSDDLDSELVKVSVMIDSAVDTCIETECVKVLEDVNNLMVNVNYSVISVEKSLDLLKGIHKSGDVYIYVDNVGNQLNKTAQSIGQGVDDAINEAEAVAMTLEKDIREFIDDLGETVSGLSFSSFLSDLDEAKESARDPWRYVYWCIVALAAVLLLISLLNLIGLIYGCFCPVSDSQARSCAITRCDRSAGAEWLVAGVTVTFIFYWIYMLVVVLLFVVGGLVHTEVCRHFVSYEKTDSRQVLDIFDNLINETVYDVTDGDVNLTYIATYENCQSNLTFYTALEMKDKGYDLNELLDLADLEAAIKKVAEDAATQIDVSGVNFTDPDISDLLISVDSILEKELTFQEFYDELNKPVTTVDLTQLAEDVSNLHGQTGVNQTAVDISVAYLNELTRSHINPITELAEDVEKELREVEVILNNHMSLAEVAEVLSNATEWFSVSANDFIDNYIETVAIEVYCDIEGFVGSVIWAVENGIGNCWPLYEAITNIVDVTCVRAVYPINAFWFCLGWCVFFLVPSVIISYKLMTLYRYTLPYSKHSDNYEEGYGGYGQAYIDDTAQEGDASNTYGAAYIDGGDSQKMLMNKSVGRGGVGEIENPLYTQENYMIPRAKVSINRPIEGSSAPYDTSPPPYNSFGYTLERHPTGDTRL